MRVTNPEDIKKLKDDPYTYEDLIIMPDGEIINANYGHVNALERILGVPRDLLYVMIDERDNPQFWLLEKTGCMSVSKRAAFGMNRTKAQKDVYKELVRNRIVSSNYYDIAAERKIAEQFYHKNVKNTPGSITSEMN